MFNKYNKDIKSVFAFYEDAPKFINALWQDLLAWELESG